MYTGQREEAVANRVLFIHHHQPKLKLQRLQRPAERRTASVVYRSVAALGGGAMSSSSRGLRSIHGAVEVEECMAETSCVCMSVWL